MNGELRTEYDTSDTRPVGKNSAICKKIRSVDVCTRYSSMQYLIILFEVDESNIPKIMERIFTQYQELENGSHVVPRYEYISMLEKEQK